MSLFSSIGKMRGPTFEVSSFSLSKNVLFWSRRSLETNTSATSIQQQQIANNKANSSLWLRRAKDRAKIYSFTVFCNFNKLSNRENKEDQETDFCKISSAPNVRRV